MTVPNPERDSTVPPSFDLLTIAVTKSDLEVMMSALVTHASQGQFSSAVFGSPQADERDRCFILYGQLRAVYRR